MKRIFLNLMMMAFATIVVCSCGDNDEIPSENEGNNATNNGTSGSESGLKPGDEAYSSSTSVGGTVGTPIDLGLPSGTLWADHNLGARNPEDYGAYIAFGEAGFKGTYRRGANYVDGKKYKDGIPYYGNENLEYCKTDVNIAYYGNFRYTKYVKNKSYGDKDDKSILESIDDAPSWNWGTKWSTPSTSQVYELMDKNYTTWSWTTKNNVNGYEVTSLINGNSIFLPAAGSYNLKTLYSAGVAGHYLLNSTGYTSDKVFMMGFALNVKKVEECNRNVGLTVRPVCK